MRKSRLSRHKQDRLIEHFVAGTTARCAAALIGVNRKTSAYYFHRLREIIADHLEREADRIVGGEIEVDESYFGGRRKGKRGRGASGKVPVFGLLKRGGRVYTKIIPDARADTLMPIIERKVIPDSIVYSDGWSGYNVLGRVGLQTLSDQPLEAVCRQAKPYQWYREFLEPGEASHAEVQRGPKGAFPTVFEGM